MGNNVYIQAQTMAADAGMQFDPRYSHWIAPRGKFEGEQWYAPYFWNMTLEGGGAETLYPDSGMEDVCGELFQVSGEESEAFGLTCLSWILVREDSQGFVMVTNHATRDEAEAKFKSWIGE